VLVGLVLTSTFRSRSEFYSPREEGRIYNIQNISLSDVPAMLLSDQVDVGVNRFGMTSSRQLYMDFTSVAFSAK
jgi:hypothetical protein